MNSKLVFIQRKFEITDPNRDWPMEWVSNKDKEIHVNPFYTTNKQFKQSLYGVQDLPIRKWVDRREQGFF